MMKIQHLIRGGDLDDTLYIRYSGDCRWSDGVLELGKNSTVGTDTYFNSCSVGKWFKYCDIDYITLKLEYSGNLMVEIFYCYYLDGQYVSETIYSVSIEAAERTSFEYRLMGLNEGSVFYRLTGLSDGARVYDACYDAKTGHEDDVTIALNICTYKREEYLMGNLDILKRSPLYLSGKLKVFITDNGGTLDCDVISDENIFVCHNPNVGGAGGFTRGLIEISRRSKEHKITNVIFMDDDVRLEPEALSRTYAMLRLLKDGYKGSFISGAMLSLNTPYIQHENGALWNEGRCIFVNRSLDLRSFENVVINELDDRRDYAAWWYCCVPISVVREDNLPIPVFIHEDDVEYSLRNARHIITMNGISIWHPVAETIRLSSNTYYNLRNLLIVNAGHCPEYGKLKLCRKLMSELGAALLRYRYRDMRLVLMALEDFCKGPEWLLGLDAVSYHGVILETGYQLYDISDRLGDYEFGKNAFYMNRHPRSLKFSRRRLLYDKYSNKGLELTFSFGQIFVCMGMYIKALYLIFTRYDKSKKEYGAQFGRLQNIEYWRKVLGLADA